MGSFTSITPKSTKDQWKKTGTGGTFTDLATGKVITKDPVPKSGPGQTPADKTAGDGLTRGSGPTGFSAMNRKGADGPVSFLNFPFQG